MNGLFLLGVFLFVGLGAYALIKSNNELRSLDVD